MARVLFFGKLGDLAGGREREMALPPRANTVSGLVGAIERQDAALGEALKEISVRCIVNEKMASHETAISEGDEIAFLPPVSGG